MSKTFKLLAVLSLFAASFQFVLAGPTLPPQASEIAQNHVPVCPGPSAPGTANCHARVVVDSNGKPNAQIQPAGYGPLQFRTAYGLTNIYASSTIAIVDAYDHPKIKSDLDKYNQQFGLPVFPNCSSSVTTGCFQKVDQRGGTRFPRSDAGWALEIAMDVEVAHGLCPTCKLILVEADSNSYLDLMTAFDRAVAMGANVISNSYGSGEFSTETNYDSHFQNAYNSNVAVTFSSGDAGYGVQYPAASPYVTAVGGTTLNLNSNNTRNTETAWSGAGSGCSAYEAKPSFQTDTGCNKRTVADVSADANPSTGAAVYDSVRYQGRSGWFKVGGTSLSAPIIAAVYALSGNTVNANALPYSNPSNLFDVTSGSNGSCSPSYLCTAVSGYDGPTGLGTPLGIAGF